LINLILFIILGFLGLKFYKVLFTPGELSGIQKQEQAQPDKKSALKRQLSDRKTKKTVRASYNSIVQNDLFRPSRSASPEEDTPLQQFTKDKPTLFGTIIMDNEKSAILEDPSSKVTKLYRINDSFAGYTIKEIQEDKVVLSKDGQSVEVKLREKKDIKMPVVRQPAVRQRRPQRGVPQRTTPRQQRVRPGSARSTQRQPVQVQSREIPPLEEAVQEEVETVPGQEPKQDENKSGDE
jgi:type II secretory pathway component PulC